MKKAVLFDCDGVLIDSEPLLAEVAAQALQKHLNLPAQPGDFLPYIGVGEDLYLGNVIRHYGGSFDPEFKHLVYAEYNRLAPTLGKEIPGASALILKLKELGFQIAVASSADRIKVDANLAILDVDPDVFDTIISGSDVERKKPYPDIYLLAAERVGVEPANCMVVEDALAGIESGKRGGMLTFALTSSLTAEALAEAKPDYIIDQLSEILPLIGH